MPILSSLDLVWNVIISFVMKKIRNRARLQ